LSGAGDIEKIGISQTGMVFFQRAQRTASQTELLKTLLLLLQQFCARLLQRCQPEA
jgi:hypothetical protein